MKWQSRSSSVPDRGPVDRSRETGEVALDGVPVSGQTRSSALLFETPYHSLAWERLHALVRFTRTEVPYPTIDVVEQEGNEIERVLNRSNRSRLLVDLRAAAPRNDPEFEVAMPRFRRKLFRGSDRIAILVRTAVGALQVKRHMREDGFIVEVLQTEEEAYAYFDAEPADSPRITVIPPSPPFRALRGR